MKHVHRILLFTLASCCILQCKTDHKSQTAQEATKPKVTDIENKQNAGQAIVAASQTFVNADCQGNATCQNVQTQAAVLASADPSQLATALTPDNIAQVTTEITNSLTTTNTEMNTNTDTKTEMNTNVNTNTSVTVSSSSQGSSSKKNAGITLMALGGSLFVVGVLAAATGYKRPKIKEGDLPPPPPSVSAPAKHYDDLETVVENLNKISSKPVSIENLRVQIEVADHLVSDQLGARSSLVEFQEWYERSRKRAVNMGAELEFEYAMDQALRNIEGTDIYSSLRGEVQKFQNRNFSKVGTVEMKMTEKKVLERKQYQADYEELRKAAALEKATQKRFTRGGKAGVAAGVFGAVVAAIGGVLYAKSGAALAEGTTNDPLTVYFTNLGQIAQQLNP